MTEDTITGTLHNWAYDPILNVIWGDIQGDTRGRFVDGDRIHTSDIPITRAGRNKNQFYKGYLVKTLNSTYLLGDPV